MKHAVHVMYLGSCSRQREALATKWTRCGVCQLDEGEAEAGRGIALGEGGRGRCSGGLAKPRRGTQVMASFTEAK